jgi:hypothetical protein
MAISATTNAHARRLLPGDAAHRSCEDAPVFLAHAPLAPAVQDRSPGLGALRPPAAPAATIPSVPPVGTPGGLVLACAVVGGGLGRACSGPGGTLRQRMQSREEDAFCILASIWRQLWMQLRASSC